MIYAGEGQHSRRTCGSRLSTDAKFIAGSGLLLPDSHRFEIKGISFCRVTCMYAMYRLKEACSDATVCPSESQGRAACTAEVYCSAFLGFDVKQKAPIVL